VGGVISMNNHECNGLGFGKKTSIGQINVSDWIAMDMPTNPNVHKFLKVFGQVNYYTNTTWWPSAKKILLGSSQITSPSGETMR
jgi:hypothetical protein